jgi:hypothetical protein
MSSHESMCEIEIQNVDTNAVNNTWERQVVNPYCICDDGMKCVFPKISGCLHAGVRQATSEGVITIYDSWLATFSTERHAHLMCCG